MGEQGQPADTSVYARSRKMPRSGEDKNSESELKRASVRYGGGRARQRPTAPNPPFYGFTIVSCLKGDIRQSADGLYIYGEDKKTEISLPTDETGRDAVVGELYEAAVNGLQPVHNGRWGMANLEVCLAVLKSSRERKEVYLSHQVSAPA